MRVLNAYPKRGVHGDRHDSFQKASETAHQESRFKTLSSLILRAPRVFVVDSIFALGFTEPTVLSRRLRSAAVSKGGQLIHLPRDPPSPTESETWLPGPPAIARSTRTGLRHTRDMLAPLDAHVASALTTERSRLQGPDAVVVRAQHVRAAEAKDEERLGGPSTRGSRRRCEPTSRYSASIRFRQFSRSITAPRTPGFRRNRGLDSSTMNLRKTIHANGAVSTRPTPPVRLGLARNHESTKVRNHDGREAHDGGVHLSCFRPFVFS